MDLDSIGFCGVDCAACPDLLRKKCPGCRQSRWPDGDPCMPVACCARRQIACCGQCAVFPCPEMRAFYGESEGHALALRRMEAVAALGPHHRERRQDQ